MSISSVAPGPGAFDPLRDIRSLAARNPAPPPTPGQAAAQAQALSKAEIANDAAQARQNPMFQAQDSRKTQAREKLQRLRDWMKIVAKLYAQNPTGMARALAQAAKDLKAALHEYEDAGGREMAMADAATEGVLAPPPDAKTADDKAAAKADDKSGADATAEPQTDGGKAPSAPSAADGAALYDAVSRSVRKTLGEDGMEFLGEVRAMVDDLGKLYASARIQAAAHRGDKAQKQAFEDADKAFKDLKDEIDQSERDIRQAAPDVGMRLSVTG